MKNYNRFNLPFIALTLPSLLGVALFNLAIDPYGLFNSPQIAGVNSLKTKQFSHVRLFKTIDVIRVKPKTLLLGSSRTDLGLNPEHPKLNSQQPAYNLGLVGPNMYEVKRYFEHTLKNQPELETVILGIDLFMFNEYKKNAVDFSENRLEKENLTIKELLNTTLSTSAIQASTATIKSNLNSDAYYLYKSNGLRYVYHNQPHRSPRKQFQGSISGLLNSAEYYQKYKLSQAFLNDFKELVSICQQRNIELKVFISPAHASQWESLYMAGLWQSFEEWKREIVQVTPIWDFSGYNTITTDSIDKNMINYWDSSHYRQEVGDLILDRLLDSNNQAIPHDFGFLITQNNIEFHLARILAERDIWIKNNPDMIDFIAQLKS